MSESLLYTAATEALVSEATGENVFKKMIEAGHNHGTVDAFSVEIRETEKAIKKDFNVKSMPGPWRSAKSVIINAMSLSIPLRDENYQFRGKTWLQNAIKRKKSVTSTIVTQEEYFKEIVLKIDFVPVGINRDELISSLRHYLG